MLPTLVVKKDCLEVCYRHEQTITELPPYKLPDIKGKCTTDRLGNQLLAENSPHGIVIENIVESFYAACAREKRTEYDDLMFRVFQLHLQKLVKELEVHTIKDHLFHYVMVVPNSWDQASFSSIQEQFCQSGLTELYGLQHSFEIIQQSDAVIRYLMELDCDNFWNGENYIVCHLSASATDVYAFEIGKPLRSEDNLSNYSLVLHRSFFPLTDNEVENQIRKFLACEDDMEKIVEYCMRVPTDDDDDDDTDEQDDDESEEDDESEDGSEVEYDEDKYLLNIADKKTLSSATIARLTSLQIKDVWNHAATVILEPIKAHCSQYHSTIMILLWQDDLEGTAVEYMYDKLDEYLSIEDTYCSDNDTYTYHLGAMRTAQIELKRSFYLPRVISSEPPKNTKKLKMSTFHHVHIDIQWDKNIATCYSADNDQRITHTETIDMNKFPTVNQSFILHAPIYGSAIRDIDVTKEYTQMTKSHTATPSAKEAKRKSIGNKEKNGKRQITRQSSQSAASSFLLKQGASKFKGIGQGSHNHYPPESLRMYIECVQSYVQKALECSGHSFKTSQYIFSLDKTILDAFLVKHDELKKELVEYYKKKDVVVKLIRQEQISAVYCKEEMKVYKTIEDHFDFPFDVLQVQFHPTYINITYHTIVSLTDNVVSAKDEAIMMTESMSQPFNMVNEMMDLLWDDIVSSEGSNIALCNKHRECEFAYIDNIYDEFDRCLRSYLTEEYLCSTEDINWYDNISLLLSTQCECRLNACKMDLYDTCVIPTIDRLFNAVMSYFFVDLDYKILEPGDFVILGTPIEASCSPMYAQIMNAIQVTFEVNEKYYDAKIHWLGTAVDVAMGEGMKTIVAHPESGMLEQVSEKMFYYRLSGSTPYYFDFDRTRKVNPHKDYPLGDICILFNEDSFNHKKSVVLYPGECRDPTSTNELKISIKFKDVVEEVHTASITIPPNGYPFILKWYLLLKEAWLALDNEEEDFPYLSTNTDYEYYECLTLRYI